ncbi:glycosyltransferase [uncultured Castellaniella sp.]|uniref:glycosyltransferase n=1 Tax=uncultured Castellaniella sp. TaxID=647907 RepID=UPI00261799AA|nr:glycosyltransferase [uncultured Castellaniella sp.]
MIHIANNFVSSKVHAELIRHLAEEFGRQDVIVPVRRASDVGKNDVDHGSVNVEYKLFSNRVVRFFPAIKIFFILCKIFSLFKKACAAQGENKEIFVVAHNFWSDGMVAFFLSFFFRFRYLMVIRNTDMNIFIPSLFYYRWMMRIAIRRSRGLVFVSEAHRRRFVERWPALFKAAGDVWVIPNGVNEYWHRELSESEDPRGMVCGFVGRFDKNKNIERIVLSCKAAYEEFEDFRLLMAGGSERELCDLLRVQKLPKYVVVRGVIGTTAELRDFYRECRVYVMPSLTETFGLAFIEALSQGCALICSRSEGIDGLFDYPYVRSVDPRSVEAIQGAVMDLLVRNPNGLDPVWVSRAIEPFSWHRIARRYQGCFA